MITSTPLTKGKPYIQPRRIEADSTVPTKIFPQLLRAIFLALAVAIFGGLLAGCLGNMLDDPIKAQGDAKAQVDGNKDGGTDVGLDQAFVDGPTPDTLLSDGTKIKDAGPDKPKSDGPTPDSKKTDGLKADGAVADQMLDAQKPIEAGADQTLVDSGVDLFQPDKTTEIDLTPDNGIIWKPYNATGDNSFTLGTASSGITKETFPDGLTLKQTWSGGCYYASSKNLPAAPFTLHNGSTTTITPALLQDSQGRWFLRLDSQTPNTNNKLRYQWQQNTLTAATGSAHLLVARLHSNESAASTGLDSSMEIYNDKWILNLGLARTQACENTQSPASCNTLAGSNPMTALHTYRADLSGSTYSVFVDGTATALLAGTSKMASSGFNGINIGDNAGSSDAVLDLYAFCVHHNGTSVPVNSPATYSRIYDLGTANNNIGLANGAKIVFTATTTSSAKITVETRTGKTAVPDTTWTPFSTLGTGGLIQSPANQYLEARFTLSTSNFDVPILWTYSLTGAKTH